MPHTGVVHDLLPGGHFRVPRGGETCPSLRARGGEGGRGLLGQWMARRIVKGRGGTLLVGGGAGGATLAFRLPLNTTDGETHS